jgi:hypothetical protein
MYFSTQKYYNQFVENLCDEDLELLELIFFNTILKKIPDFIMKMKNIRILQFYNTKISFITEEFCSLKTLNFIKFTSNIKYIPYNFGNLINLKTFSLHLEYSPGHIDFHIYKMKKLIFWENTYKGQIQIPINKIKTICLFV